MAKDRTNRVTIVGQGSVGKSSLTLQFIYNEFIENYEPTKGDSYRKVIDSDEGEENLDILDTAGEELFMNSSHPMYTTAEGFILVCSLDDPLSIRALGEFRDNILMTHPNIDNLPLLLVLNKVDLLDMGGDKHKAAAEETEAFAAKYGIPLIKTSAKNRENVDETFLTMNRMISQRKDELESIISPAKKKRRFRLKKIIKKYIK